ncbi:MAG: reverse transcriptase domain-containing protein [Bacillota bacterium]
MKKAQQYIRDDRRVVVDMDLEKFFGRVNCDILMSRVARKVKHKRILKLIRAYLQAGIVVNGCRVRSEEATPQGGLLSLLLDNIMLDDLDKELQQRAHKFVHYADDANVHVRTQRARERA